ncbi:molybdenum cofactor guanylyltransferase [Gordonia sp. PDNC005]|uniref:molybdenum cofactor guanylyltransferase n=1 Tax=unclassified Gordonia (in: high G+C Gram-positive bacteria) TaxID=2657482 RepID=UPI0019667676|nr:molybdenum cofactor guanylyltransferase [Gordonia sp. PDNC005]QRY64324.1 molybdenum cofactor guanylyltransferase [Gordonia sp. PDNC005]
MTAAIVLGGGRATRLDGADKASITVRGRSLIDHVFAAVAACPQVIAVGPDTLARPGVTVLREDPPFGGPVAGIAAAMQAVEDDDVWLLACDLPRATEIVQRLADEPIGDDDGVILVDAAGRAQWLAGRYRTAALGSALSRIGAPHGASMRQLVDGLNLRAVHDHTGATADLDTWAEVADYRLRTKGTIHD